MSPSMELEQAAQILSQGLRFGRTERDHADAVELLERLVGEADRRGVIHQRWADLGPAGEALWALREAGLVSGRSGEYLLHRAEIRHRATEIEHETIWPQLREPATALLVSSGRIDAFRASFQSRGNIVTWCRARRRERALARRARRSAGYERWFLDVAEQAGWPIP